jgi:tetratricopeptide (TPR) repeat protein
MQQRARLHQSLVLAGMRQSRYVITSEAMEHARAYVQVLEASGDSTWLPSAYFQLGLVLLWARELAEAEQLMLKALVQSEQRGDVSLEGRCLTYLTFVYRWLNQPDKVQAYAERSLRHATRIGMAEYVGAARGNMAWLAWRRQEMAMVREQGGLALEAWREMSVMYIFQWSARWPLLGAALKAGRLVEALNHARIMLEPSQPRMPDVLEAGLENAVRAADAGDFGAARAYLEPLLAPARALNYL